MSTSNIPSCVLNQVRQFQQDFQQFGRDLRSGNVSQARSDYVTLQKEVPQFNSPQTTDCDNQLSEAANELAQAPPSGNSRSAHAQGPATSPDSHGHAAATHSSLPNSGTSNTSPATIRARLSIFA